MIRYQGPVFIDAPCVGEWDLFFAPTEFESREAKTRRRERAKAICHRCPFIEPCAEWAVRNCEKHGVWGGLDEDDRGFGGRKGRLRVRQELQQRLAEKHLPGSAHGR